jgi:N-formylglutamate amidohydrolase
LAGELALSPERLWSDWLTRELYSFLPELGVTTVSTPLSRFVADVNRDPAGDQHGGFFTSVVTARTPHGQPVYRRPLEPDEIRERVVLAHEPFHRALDQVVDDLTHRFGRVLLLDLHSFGVQLDTDVVLGDRNGASASPDVMDEVAQAFADGGFRVRRNARFTGGWTVRRFAGDDRVEAIQVELHHSCYLDWQGPRSGPPERGPSFGPAQQRLRAVLGRLVAGR